MFSGLGGKPSEDKAKTNVFGSVPAFGSTTTSSCNLHIYHQDSLVVQSICTIIFCLSINGNLTYTSF